MRQSTLAFLGMLAGAVISTTPLAAAQPAADAVTPEKIDQELEKSAAELRARYNANAARYVYYDIAWPRDADEHVALGKHAVLLVVAISQDKTELPMRRVFGDGRKEVQLRAIATRERPTAPGSEAHRVFGAHRHETLYIVPTELLLQERALAGDFAANRKDFRIARGPFEGPLHVKAADKKAGKLVNTALADMVAREFPGFTVKR
jgi:hypothetical protein